MPVTKRLLSRAALALALVAGSALIVGLVGRAAADPDATSTTTTPAQSTGRGELRYRIYDADTGKATPGKLTFRGVEGTHTPRLGPRTGKRDGEAFVAFNRAFSATGTGTIAVPFGTYDVFVSQGIEWTLKKRRVRVTATGARIEARLRRVVDTSGWLSADLHVHSAWSRDSPVPPEARVQQFLADGVELIVATEHNVQGDYEPIISSLGARHLLASARGMEITTRRWGHLGLFPMPAGQTLTRDDIRRFKRSRSAKAIIRRVREVAPEVSISVCHPHITTSSYFADGGLDPRRDTAGPGFSFDFDAVEILNGYHAFSFRRSIDRNLSRWFHLLDHGHMVAATAGSDSHGLGAKGGQGGYPRSYLLVADDGPESVTPLEASRALKSMRLLFTTGPFVRVRVGRKTMGDVAAAPGGKARVHIEVQAAPWISADQVTIYVNGRVDARYRIPPSREVVRFRGRHDVTMTTDRDGYVVVRVDGKRDLRPVAGTKKHVIPPVAITNPIFLDVDGNGAYDQRKPHGRH